MSTTTRGHLAAAYCMTVWASTFILTKLLLRSFSSIEIVFLRSVIAYIALSVMSPKPVRTGSFKGELPYILAGFLGIPGYFILENTGLVYTTATNSSIILNTAPLFIVLLSWLFLKERSGIHANFFIGFVMAITGITLISLGSGGSLSGGGDQHLIGDLMTIAAALTWGFYTLATHKIDQVGEPVLKTTRRIFFWGLVWTLPFLSLGFHPSLAALRQPGNLICLLFLGVFASCLSFVMWNYAVRAIGPVKSSIYIYGQPVVSVAASFIVLKEKITPMIILGIVLTLIGVILSGHRRVKPRVA